MLFVAVFLIVVCPIVFAWAWANSGEERAELRESTGRLGSAMFEPFRPLLERVARLLSR